MVTFALSTASVYPEDTARGFEYAAKVGYDAVEVMVALDAGSQSIRQVVAMSEYYEMPVSAIHAPCLLVTQRVWGTDPWEKLERAGDMALAAGAKVVVVHPPFRWQKDYVAEFVQGIADLEASLGINYAVENMYPWRGPRSRDMQAYAPSWDPTDNDYAHMTLDVSHAATARLSSLELAQRMGDRLTHLHLTDGSGSAKDEHLVPGRGEQPCVELLNYLASTGFDGQIVLEINTRRSGTREERESDITESLDFARLHFA